MAVRALIIAIEEYPEMGGLSSSQLEGTNEAARSFYAWLTGRKEVAPESIYVCCGDPGFAPNTRGTGRMDVLYALRDLAHAGRDRTEELFVFYSGHGLVRVDNQVGDSVDLLVGSDAFPPDLLGEACINVQELKDWLRKSMGTGDHYYFIDACRNPVRTDDLAHARITLPIVRSEKKQPQVRGIHSTTSGFTADVRSGFSRAVLDALHGRGRKEWYGEELWVTFHNLCEYVKAQVQDQEVDPDPGATPTRLLKLTPVPEHDCQIHVDGARPDDQFTLTLHSNSVQPVEITFTGTDHVLRVKPAEYWVSLKGPSTPIRRIDPPDPPPGVPLWDPTSLRFEVGTTAPSDDSPLDPDHPSGDLARLYPESVLGTIPDDLGSAILDIRAPADVVTTLRSVSDGTSTSFRAGRHGIRHGSYQIKVREHGLTLRSEERDIPPGAEVRLDLRHVNPPTTVHQTLIARASPQGDSDATPAFFRALGTINADLGLWLSLIGTARIVASPEQQGVLRNLPLSWFEDISAGASPIWVLAGFAHKRGPFSIALDGGLDPTWYDFLPNPDLVGIYESVFPDAGVGSHLLSIHEGGLAPLTFVVPSLPNRTTLVILTESERGGLEIHQYVLPLYHLLHHLDRTVLSRLPEEPLSVMRTMFMAQKQYARHRAIEPRTENSELDRKAWEDLTYAKWLDPVMSLIAAHELIRVRDFDEDLRQLLGRIVANMRQHFPGLADVEAIAETANIPQEKFEGFPILSESVMVFRALDQMVDFPLPDARANFGTPWNSWTAAVRPPESERA
jgi:hypothetical protein